MKYVVPLDILAPELLRSGMVSRTSAMGTDWRSIFGLAVILYTLLVGFPFLGTGSSC